MTFSSEPRKEDAVTVVSSRLNTAPVEYITITWERAEKLANLRRGLLRESAWAAIGGFAATVPGAADALSTILSTVSSQGGRTTFAVSTSQAMSIALFLIFLTCAVIAILSRAHEPSSTGYLFELFGKPVVRHGAERWLHQFFHPAKRDDSEKTR